MLSNAGSFAKNAASAAPLTSSFILRNVFHQFVFLDRNLHCKNVFLVLLRGTQSCSDSTFVSNTFCLRYGLSRPSPPRDSKHCSEAMKLQQACSLEPQLEILWRHGSSLKAGVLVKSTTHSCTLCPCLRLAEPSSKSSIQSCKLFVGTVQGLQDVLEGLDATQDLPRDQQRQLLIVLS